MADAFKKMTMMRLGELSCFDEEQRIAIMDLVKDGVLSIDEALAEVRVGG
jgi:polyhydroxyalkanoate synthesis regulator phasin